MTARLAAVQGRRHEGLVEEYVEWLHSWSAADTTVAQRGDMLGRLLREWGLTGFTKANVTTFLANPNLKSKWSRSTYFNHLKCICGYLSAAGHIDVNPMEGMRPPRRPDSVPRPLTEDEANRVLEVAGGDVRTWILLALGAGLRAHEIAKIRGEDVTREGIYVNGKGGKEVILPCHEDLWEVAQRYPRSGFWFPGNDRGHIRTTKVSNEVGKLFKALGIEGSVHRCRHLFATRLLRRGVHIRKVQRLMRHASLSTTANYTAVDEAELDEAVTMLGSLAPGDRDAQVFHLVPVS